MQKTKNPQLVFTLVLASYATSFAGSSLSVSIKIIGEEFAVPAATLGWLITAFSICTVSLNLPLGRLGDLSSRRTLLNIGLGLFSLSTFASVFAPSLQVLIVFRVVQGLGSACILASNQAIMVDAFPPEVRGRMLGISTSATYIGLASGPIIGGFVTQNFGWRTVFVFMSILGAIAFFVTLGRLPANSSRVEASELTKHLDIPGILLFIFGISLLSWGTNSIASGGIAIVAIVVGVITLSIFVWWETRARSPILNPALFKGGRSFALANISAFLNYTAAMSITYLISIYLQQAKGLGSDRAGLVLVTAPLVQAGVSIMAGRLADRYQAFKLASIGCGFCASALILLAFVKPETSILYIMFCLVLNGIGFGFFASPNTSAALSLVPRGDVGIASAFLSTMRNLGSIVSMSVIATVTSFAIGNLPINQVSPLDLTTVMRTCFIIFSGIGLLSVFTSLQQKTPMAAEGDSAGAPPASAGEPPGSADAPPVGAPPVGAPPDRASE
ncbi:MAG: MFS transporter [Coriobacteriia bacterium]|nr:MFS transporter [Coriobacteriia bacterium]